MKHTPFNSLARNSILFILPALFIAIGCKKNVEERNLVFSGMIKDDKTGLGVSTGGTIKVDGFDATATGYLDKAWKENIGSGTINADGSFTVSFKSWTNATRYYFYFQYNNNSYINNGSAFLNTSYLDPSLFASGNYSMNLQAAKMTGFRVNFRNIMPFNNNDRLHINLPSATSDILFGYLMPRWENLQFCIADPMTWNIDGGANASGSLVCNVPADRKFSIRWTVKKNGIEQAFQDSVLCPHDINTVYNLDY